MNKMYTVLLTLAAFAMLVPAAAAADCAHTASPVATIPDATGSLGGDLYVVNDLCEPVVGNGSCTFSIWIYQETNGQAGLQRGDEVENDCAAGGSPDTDIF